MQQNLAREDLNKLASLYPDMVNVLLIPAKNSKLKAMPKSNILMSKVTTIANIQSTIKKRLVLKNTEAVFLFAYNTLLQCNDTVGDLQTKFATRMKNKQLEIQYTEYSVFG